MKWRIRAKNWEEFPVTQKWFAVGEAMAHLDHLIAGAHIERRIKGKIGTYFAR
jgi:hypothetical protein